MKMVLGMVAVLGASFSLTGCLFGCDPGNNSQRAPVAFTPSSSSATQSCGSYQMKLLGDTTAAPPYTLVEIDIAATVPVGQAAPLWMNDTSDGAHSSDNKIAFSIQAASNLDSTPLASVVVTPEALPTLDGSPMTVELQLTFEDGRVLDQVYTAPVVNSAQGQCGI